MIVPPRSSYPTLVGLAFCCLGISGAAALRSQDVPAAINKPAAEPAASGSATRTATAPGPVSSRDGTHNRARDISKIYLSTLEVMHDRYFHGQRAIVPARAMEDVFKDVERQLDVRARWIAVNTKAMSLNHEVKTEFEKAAAAAIAQGQPEFESTIDGMYHLAVAVPLHEQCINCHAGMFRELPKQKSFAGLIISMPATISAAGR